MITKLRPPENKVNMKKTTMIIIFFIIFILMGIVSLGIGVFDMTPIDTFKIVIAKILGKPQTWPDKMNTVIFKIRLPRVISGALIGASLATAGGVYQGVFQNPMVSPDVMGASSGAGLGAAIALLNGWSYTMVTMSSFAFGLISVLIAYIISMAAKNKSIVSLVLGGMMVSWITSAATSYVKIAADPQNTLPAITYWLMGSLSSITLKDLKFLYIPILIGIIPMFLLRWKLNMLTLSDTEAKSMGVNTGKYRLLFVICSTLITAASVSVSGMIGWVGLVIPHIARKFVGNNYKYLLPSCMALGGTFLILVDNFARTMSTSEIPLGILTAFVGAPFFILLLVTRKGDSW